jgi:hypothetical protein
MKSYISRKFPLETRTTDQIFIFRSSEKLIVYAGLGENDHALDWLEKAYGDHSNAIVFLKVGPQLDTRRSNPRFQELQHKLRLPK